MRPAPLIPVLVLLLSTATSAQAPTVAFEVASVRPNRDQSSASRFEILPSRRLVITRFPLAALIEHAFGYPAVRRVGMPGWAETEEFDVIANAPMDVPWGSQTAMSMLRTLLTARFRLSAHVETRDLPIYKMTLARDDGRLGPSLRQARSDCSAFVPGRAIVPEPNAGPACSIMGRSTTESGVTRFSLAGRSMLALASHLQLFVDRPVVDATGLAGLFDVELAFTFPGSSDGRSLFSAAQEQLGLKLEPSRDVVNVLVIDSVERPTPD